MQTLQELGKTISRNVKISGVGAYAVDDVDSYVIGHGIVGKDIPIMARLAKARCWSKR